MAGHSTKYPFPTLVFQALAAYDSPVSRACHTPIALLKTTAVAVDIDVPIYLVPTPVEPWVLETFPFFYARGPSTHHQPATSSSAVFSRTIRRAGARARRDQEGGIAQFGSFETSRRLPSPTDWECLFGAVGTVVYLCLLACLVWVGPCQRLRVCIQSLALPRGAGQTYDAPSQPFPVMTPVLAAHKLVRVRVSTLLEMGWFIRGPPACLCQSCL